MVTDSVRFYNFSLSPWWWQIQKHSVRFYNLKFGQWVSFPLHRKEPTEKPLKAMQLEDRTKMSWIPWVWPYHVEKSQWKACTRTDWKFNFCPWQFLWFCPVGSIGTTTMAAHGSTPLDKLSTGKLFFMSSKWEILHIDTTHESTAKLKHSKLNFPGIIISNVVGTYRYILRSCHITYGSQTLPIIQFPSLTKVCKLEM